MVKDEPQNPSYPATAGHLHSVVDSLDLEPVVFKLTHAELGEEAMTLAHADRDIALYRCFLKRACNLRCVIILGFIRN
jgi:hypothetical protein